MLIKLMVFLIALVFDLVYASYIIHTSDGNAGRASLLSGLVFILSAIMTLAYIEDIWNLPFTVAGGMLGTYIAVTREKRNKNPTVSSGVF